MKKMKSFVIAMFLVFSLTICVVCDNMISKAHADVLSTTTVLTSGGNGGKVHIKSDVFRNRVQVTSGVYRYDFGVNSFVLESSNLKTNFVVSGKYYASQNASGTPFSVSKYGTLVNNQKSGGTQYSFYSLYTTTTTSSSAFGSSTQNCNATF